MSFTERNSIFAGPLALCSWKAIFPPKAAFPASWSSSTLNNTPLIHSSECVAVTRTR